MCIRDRYADVYTWCAGEGYVDYIIPQVYFGLEHGTHDFVSVCRTWSGIIQTQKVTLLVGMTLGKAKSREDQWAGAGKYEWRDHRDVLARSLQTTRDLPHSQGVVFFCYQYFFHPLTGAPVVETAQEVNALLPVLDAISWD